LTLVKTDRANLRETLLTAEKALKRCAAKSSIAAVALAATGALAALSSSARIEPSPIDGSSAVTVVYVGADDCAPCRNWRREHWPKFQASSIFARLTYREVTSPRLFDLLKDDYWPYDLRAHRAALDKTSGVPLWLIVASDGTALTARGLSEWERVAIPAIRSLAR